MLTTYHLFLFYLQEELKLPVPQTLALFNKSLRKLSNYLKQIKQQSIAVKTAPTPNNKKAAAFLTNKNNNNNNNNSNSLADELDEAGQRVQKSLNANIMADQGGDEDGAEDGDGNNNNNSDTLGISSKKIPDIVSLPVSAADKKRKEFDHSNAGGGKKKGGHHNNNNNKSNFGGKHHNNFNNNKKRKQ